MMNENDLQAMLEQLREVSGHFETARGRLIIPGWDEEFFGERHQAIRTAARAIAAEGLTGDEGTRLTIRQLGCLVRYIADILEPGLDEE